MKRFSSVVSAVRRHPKFAVAALFVVVAVVFAVRPSVGWEALTAAVAFVFGCGVGGARRQRMDAREVTE